MGAGPRPAAPDLGKCKPVCLGWGYELLLDTDRHCAGLQPRRFGAMGEKSREQKFDFKNFFYSLFGLVKQLLFSNLLYPKH